MEPEPVVGSEVEGISSSSSKIGMPSDFSLLISFTDFSGEQNPKFFSKIRNCSINAVENKSGREQL